MLSLSAWCEAWHVACSLKNSEVCSLHSSQPRHYSAAISPCNCYGLAANVIETGGWTGFIWLSVGGLKTALSCREISELQPSEQEKCRVNKGQSWVRRREIHSRRSLCSLLSTFPKPLTEVQAPTIFLSIKKLILSQVLIKINQRRVQEWHFISIQIKIESNQSWNIKVVRSIFISLSPPGDLYFMLGFLLWDLKKKHNPTTEACA